MNAGKTVFFNLWNFFRFINFVNVSNDTDRQKELLGFKFKPSEMNLRVYHRARRFLKVLRNHTACQCDSEKLKARTS